MYSVYADYMCIYDDSLPYEGTALMSPKVTIEKNAAGTFTFGLPPTNIGYNFIEMMATEITVYKDGTAEWCGRPISESKDFYNNRTITCEGELAYMNDIIIPPIVWQGTDGNGVNVFDWLPSFLTICNDIYSAAGLERHYYYGDITYYGDLSTAPKHVITSSYDSAMTVLQNALDKFGGYVTITRSVTGDRYFNWYQDRGPDTITASQIIEFGSNLLDFVVDRDETDMYTAIVPCGAELQDDALGDFGKNLRDTYGVRFPYTTTARFPFNGDGPYDYSGYYVKNQDRVNKYGLIMKKLEAEGLQETTDTVELWTYGVKALNNAIYDHTTYRVTALDLNIMRNGKIFIGSNIEQYTGHVYDADSKTLLIDTKSTDMTSYSSRSKTLYIDQPQETLVDISSDKYAPFKIGDNVRVISDPHDLDTVMSITRIEIPLDSPQNTAYTLGRDTAKRITASDNVDNSRSNSIGHGSTIPGSDAVSEVYSDAIAYIHSDNLVRINAKKLIRVQIDGINKFAMRDSGTWLQYDQWHLVKIYESGVALLSEQPGETGRYKGQIDVNDSSITLSVVDKKDASRGVQMWFEPGVGIRANPAPWSSDRKKKYDIDYNVDGDLVDRLKPAYFKLKLDNKSHFGFIAQDVLEVTPEIVFDINVPDGEGGISESYMALNYHEFIPILTAKIQSQEKRIKDLEDKVQTLLELIQNGGESHG